MQNPLQGPLACVPPGSKNSMATVTTYKNWTNILDPTESVGSIKKSNLRKYQLPLLEVRIQAV